MKQEIFISSNLRFLFSNKLASLKFAFNKMKFIKKKTIYIPETKFGCNKSIRPKAFNRRKDLVCNLEVESIFPLFSKFFYHY